MHIFTRMHQQDIFILRRLGRDEITRLCQTTFQQPLVNHPVFLRRKNMRADGQIVIVAVDKFERKHCRSRVTLHVFWRKALRSCSFTRWLFASHSRTISPEFLQEVPWSLACLWPHTPWDLLQELR